MDYQWDTICEILVILIAKHGQPRPLNGVLTYNDLVSEDIIAKANRHKDFTTVFPIPRRESFINGQT